MFCFVLFSFFFKKKKTLWNGICVYGNTEAILHLAPVRIYFQFCFCYSFFFVDSSLYAIWLMVFCLSYQNNYLPHEEEKIIQMNGKKININGMFLFERRKKNNSNKLQQQSISRHGLRGAKGSLE